MSTSEGHKTQTAQSKLSTNFYPVYFGSTRRKQKTSHYEVTRLSSVDNYKNVVKIKTRGEEKNVFMQTLLVPAGAHRGETLVLFI